MLIRQGLRILRFAGPEVLVLLLPVAFSYFLSSVSKCFVNSLVVSGSAMCAAENYISFEICDVLLLGEYMYSLRVRIRMQTLFNIVWPSIFVDIRCITAFECSVGLSFYASYKIIASTQ